MEIALAGLADTVKYLLVSNLSLKQEAHLSLVGGWFTSDFTSYNKAEKTAKLIADDAIEDLCQKYDIDRKKVKVNYNGDNFNPLEIVITYEDDGKLTLRKFEKVIKVKEI